MFVIVVVIIGLGVGVDVFPCFVKVRVNYKYSSVLLYPKHNSLLCKQLIGEWNDVDFSLLVSAVRNLNNSQRKFLN